MIYETNFRSLLDDLKHKIAAIENLKEKKLSITKKYQNDVKEQKMLLNQAISQVWSKTKGFSELNALGQTNEELGRKTEWAEAEKKRLEQSSANARSKIEFKGKQLEMNQWLKSKVEERQESLTEKMSTLAMLQFKVRILPRKTKIKESISITKAPSVSSTKVVSDAGKNDDSGLGGEHKDDSKNSGPGAQSTPALAATLVQQNSSGHPNESPIRRPPSSSPYLNKVWTTPGSERSTSANDFKTPQKSGPSPEWKGRTHRRLLVDEANDTTTTFANTPIPQRFNSLQRSHSIRNQPRSIFDIDNIDQPTTSSSMNPPAKPNNQENFDFFSGAGRSFLNFDEDRQRDNFSAFNFDAFTEKGFNFKL